MNGEGGTAVKQILLAIENGALPPDETQRRLIGLIQKEATRIDGPANEELISACMNLMERLQGCEPVEDGARIAALNQRIADAIQEKKRNQERWRTTFRTVGAVAAVLVLLLGIGIPLRWTWFVSWSTPDEQQHVIMGHEITVDMVATAIAENKANEPIVVSDFSEFEKHLGFDPGIPFVLSDEWVADYGSIRYFSGYIQIVAMYVHMEDPDASITCTINYFADIEYAYFSFEQNCEGEKQRIQSLDFYLSNNIKRNSATWFNNNMYAKVTGQITSAETVEILLRLIGANHE